MFADRLSRNSQGGSRTRDHGADAGERAGVAGQGGSCCGAQPAPPRGARRVPRRPPGPERVSLGRGTLSSYGAPTSSADPALHRTMTTSSTRRSSLPTAHSTKSLSSRKSQRSFANLDLPSWRCVKSRSRQARLSKRRSGRSVSATTSTAPGRRSRRRRATRARSSTTRLADSSLPRLQRQRPPGAPSRNRPRLCAQLTVASPTFRLTWPARLTMANRSPVVPPSPRPACLTLRFTLRLAVRASTSRSQHHGHGDRASRKVTGRSRRISPLAVRVRLHRTCSRPFARRRLSASLCRLPRRFSRLLAHRLRLFPPLRRPSSRRQPPRPPPSRTKRTSRRCTLGRCTPLLSGRRSGGRKRSRSGSSRLSGRSGRPLSWRQR